MVQFIDDHRDVFGVEPICAVLPNRPVDGLIAIGTSGQIRRPGPRGRSATISSASRFSGAMTSTRRSTAPESLAAAAAGRRPRGALHRGAPHARDEPRRRRPGSGLDHHDPRR